MTSRQWITLSLRVFALALIGITIRPVAANIGWNAQGLFSSPGRFWVNLDPHRWIGDALLLGTVPGLNAITAPALLPGYLSAVMQPLRISCGEAAYIMVRGRICRVEAGQGVRVGFISDPPDITPDLAAAWDNAAALGVEVEPQPWRRLQVLAAKILTPETEYSRLHGAGAGFIDRD